MHKERHKNRVGPSLYCDILICALLALFLLLAQAVTAPAAFCLDVGYITTAAGTGTKGYSGDGGPATSAQMNSVWGVAVDKEGNLYIADSANRVIREVASWNHTQFGINMTAGNIYTVAGNGTSGYSGDNGPATNAQLASPQCVAVDQAGNLFYR